MNQYLILLLAFSINLKSQDYCFENGPPLTLESKPINEILKYKARMDEIDILSIKESCRWAFYWRKSSYELYSDGDSTSYYLRAALNENSKTVCRVLQANKEIIEDRIELEQLDSEHKWYYLDVELSDQNYIDSICSQDDFAYKARTYDEMTNLERLIMFNDQEGRKFKEVDWSKQHKLDKSNREVLDSIYLKNKYLKGFTTYEIDAFSLVLQHSSDCEWNLKWFTIFLEAKSKYNISGGQFLGIAFDRMLNKNSELGGKCWEDDPSLAAVYIEELRSKYSMDFAIKHGFHKLLMIKR